LNQSFVNEFTKRKIAVLAEPSIELLEAEDMEKTLFEDKIIYEN